ncbi:MAG: hypothetical protein FVQ84_22700 [Planctomycetes bacterium]|nr:hypothetical protein [Planctomycetota bacterium]
MPPGCPSLVHSKETALPITSTATFGDSLRAASYPAFSAAYEIYSAIDDIDHTGNSAELGTCRDHAWFARNDESGEIRIAAKTCHLRWCPLCAHAKRNFIGFKVKEWVDTLKYPKFLTLTLKHRDTDLRFQIDELYRYFRILRRRKHFNDLVTGGIWFFQVKKSKNDKLWHPHIHCLIGGSYIPHGWLKRTWEQITFGSTVVDIRPIKDSSGACNDAARYAAAPGPLVGLSLSDGVELVRSMQGRRIVGTWGTARTVKLRPPKVSDSGKWSSVGSWSYVMNNRKFNRNAEAIAYAFYNQTPLPSGIDMSALDPSLHRMDQIDLEDYDLDAMYPKVGKPP